jgi:hypothetical protein
MSDFFEDGSERLLVARPAMLYVSVTSQLKERIRRVAGLLGWSLSKASYYAMLWGIEKLEFHAGVFDED